MSKAVSFFISYLIVPLLILLYVTTDLGFFKYMLGTLCVVFFIVMGLVVFAMTNRHLKPKPEDILRLRSALERKRLARALHLLMGLVIAMAIFVYVNTFIAMVYCGSLLLLQIMLYKVRKAAFE